MFIIGAFIFITYACCLVWDIRKEQKEEEKYPDICHYSGLPSVMSYNKEDKKRAGLGPASLE